MEPGIFPDPKSTQEPTQRHTEGHANRDGQRELDSIDIAENMSANDAELIYDGAESGANRSFAKNPSEADSHNTLPETEAHVGNLTSRVIHSDSQGISNHSANDEAAGQQKVTDARPDSQAGTNHSR